MNKEGINEGTIKAIVFDVGGVLMTGKKKKTTIKTIHSPGIHESVAKQLGISLDQYFDSIDTAYAKSMEGQISKNILLDTISFNLNFPRKKIERIFTQVYKKTLKKNKWLYHVAAQLKKKGYKIIILSDQWHLSKEALITKEDYSLFDKVILSCDVGMRKPSKQIYNFLLEQVNLKPHQVLFIDNQEWNIVPANRLGMKTILYVDNQKTKEQFAHYGIYVK